MKGYKENFAILALVGIVALVGVIGLLVVIFQGSSFGTGNIKGQAYYNPGELPTLRDYAVGSPVVIYDFIGNTSFNGSFLDTDAGQNIYVKGDIKVKEYNLLYLTDFCVRNGDVTLLSEYYLSGTKKVLMQYWKCAYDCSNGACSKRALV